MPLLEMAAREKVYSVFARRPSTTYEDLGSKTFFSCWYKITGLLIKIGRKDKKEVKDKIKL